MGSGCGSVGRAVAFNTRGPRFDSNHQQNFIEHMFIISCIEKTKINKKMPGMAHFNKKVWKISGEHKNMSSKGAAIALCFRLRLPSCGPGFESQAHHLHFFQFVLLKLLLELEKNENKQK